MMGLKKPFIASSPSALNLKVAFYVEFYTKHSKLAPGDALSILQLDKTYSPQSFIVMLLLVHRKILLCLVCWYFINKTCC